MKPLVLAFFLGCTVMAVAQSGKFVGITMDGVTNSGKLFSFKGDGTGVSVLKEFPLNTNGEDLNCRTFTEGPNGDLYGMTSRGGLGRGTLFKVRVSDHKFIKLFDFPLVGSVGYPAGNLVLAPNGYFYGYQHRESPAATAIFRIKPDGTDYSVVNNTISGRPQVSGTLLLASNGFLYGTTRDGGTDGLGQLFRLTFDGMLEVLLSFSDATTKRNPTGTLVEVEGKIYGGVSGSSASAIFQVSLDGTGYTTLYDFPAVYIVNDDFFRLVYGPNNSLYGIVRSSLFKLGLDGSGFTKVKDLYNADTQNFVLDTDNRIYYAETYGRIRSMTLDGDDEKTIGLLPDGSSPRGIALLQNGIIIGLCRTGGTGDKGFIYSIDTRRPVYSNQFEVIKDFNESSEARRPVEHVTLLDDGDLIGVTKSGGEKNKGVMFRMSADGTNYRELFDFSNSTLRGQLVDAPVKGNDGYYYGVTTNEGIYRIREDGTDFSKILDRYTDNFFSDGFSAQLLPGSDGKLYGVVASDDDNPYGYVFSVNTDGSGYQVVHSFDITTGYAPRTALIDGSDGFLYGTCSGGPGFNGSIFRMKPDGTQFTTIFMFKSPVVGGTPYGNFFMASNGKLVGAGTRSSTNSRGLVFSVNTDGSNYTMLHEFDEPTTGDFIVGSGVRVGMVVEGPDHFLYGIEPRGGVVATGTAFKMGLDGSNYTKLELNFNDNPFAAVTSWGGLTFVPDKQRQTITFGELTPKELNSASFTLNASSSSSLVVTYTSTNPAVATINGDIVTLLSEGVTNIVATQSGNSNYFAAPQVTQQLRVGKLTVSPVLTSAVEGKVGEEIELTTDFTGPKDLLVYTVINESGSAIVTGGNKLVLTGAGTVKINVSLAANDVYHPISVDASFNILKRSIQPRITSASTGITGSFLPLETFTDGSTGQVTYTITDLTGSAILSNKILTLKNAGTITVQADIAPDANSNAASVSQYITINSTTPGGPQVFGTMRAGGSSNGGVIYSVNPDGTGYRVLKDFLPSADGGRPEGLNVQIGTKFYGIVFPGTGVGNRIFEFDLSTMEYRRFTTDQDISLVRSTLVLNDRGGIYGLSRSIVNNKQFSLIEFNPQTGSYSFASQPFELPGSDQQISLIGTKDGKLFGTTALGQDEVYGVYGTTIFEIETSSGVVKSKLGTNWNYDLGPLAEGPDGMLYGYGREGSTSYGYIGRYNRNTNVFESIHDFDSGVNGSYPTNTDIPLFNSNGKLYGSTVAGLQNNLGALFEFDPVNETVTNKYEFTDLHGSFSTTGKVLVQVSDDILFGSIYLTNGGRLFNLNLSSGEYKETLLSTSTGLGPSGNLVFSDIQQVIYKLDQTIDFQAITDKTLGESPANLVAIASSTLPVSFSTTSDKVSISGSHLTLIKAGKVKIVASQSGNINYNQATAVERTFCVNPSKPEIAVINQQLTSSNETGNQWYLDGEMIIGAVNKVYNVTEGGAYTVKTTIEECESEMSEISDILVDNPIKEDQTITFDEIGNKTFGDDDFTLIASSTSELPITFSSSDHISITGDVVTLLKPGKATITANQEGNDDYNPATPVNRSFCINPAKPNIVAAGATLTSSNDTGNQWYHDGTPIDGAINETYTAAESGSYTVQTTIEECASEISTASVVTITGLEKQLLETTLVYPNSTNKDLIVELPHRNQFAFDIVVSDVLGRIAMQRVSTAGTTERFDVSTQPKGVYLIRISSNGESIVRKIVIN